MSSEEPKVVVVIPARYGSTRLPGKPLVPLAGKPMVQRVYERAKQAQTVHRVLVATDDQRIMDAVAAFGGEARMTRADHRTGTERIAEVAAHQHIKRDRRQYPRQILWRVQPSCQLPCQFTRFF